MTALARSFLEAAEKMLRTQPALSIAIKRHATETNAVISPPSIQ
jgi:DNA-binding transcriptional LysR family regulator